MKKRSLVCTLAIIGVFSLSLIQANAATAPFGYDLQKDINRSKNAAKAQQQKNTQSAKPASKANTTATTSYEKQQVYYPNASLTSAISKYKNGNYTGAQQELESFVKKHPNNAVAHYYLGMSYAQVGKKDDAVKAYEKAIELGKNNPVSNYASRGKDCLTGGPTCKGTTAASGETGVEDDAKLDEFIQAPYGNGMSPELQEELRKKQLERIQKNINKDNLKPMEIEQIKQFDDFQSEAVDRTKIAQASDADVVNAIKVLREAGMTVTIQPANGTAANNAAMNNAVNQIPGFNPNDPEFIKNQQQFQEMSMMLGNKNNNNNNNFVNMLPYMMSQGQNMDPQIIQAMMMNSMLPDFTMDMGSNDK